MHTLDLYLLVAAVLGLFVLLKSRRRVEGYNLGGIDVDEEREARCKEYADPSLWGTYYFKKRKHFPGKDPEWQCPQGWTDTGCTSDMERKLKNKQCRRNKYMNRTERPDHSCDSNKDCDMGRECSDNGFCQDRA